MKTWLASGVLLVACGGAAAAGAPPAETITVAPPPEAPVTAAKMDPPQWLDASTGDDADADPVASSQPPPAIPDGAAARGPVRIGAVTVTGGRTAELVQRVLLGSTAEMNRCHDAAIARGTRPTGPMRVKLMVASSGQIVSAVHVGGSMEPPLVRCVLDAAKRVRFPRAVGPSVEVNFPVQFTP